MVDYVDFARVRELPEFATVDTVYFVQPNAGDPVRQFITGDDAVPVEIAAATAAQQLFDAGLIDAPTVAAMVAYLRVGNIEAGTVTELPQGAAPTVTLVRDELGDVTLSFGIPRGTGPQGDPGPAGAAATVTATATTGAAGTDVSVVNGGTPNNRTLAFTIPRGATGDVTPAALDAATRAENAAQTAQTSANQVTGVKDKVGGSLAYSQPTTFGNSVVAGSAPNGQIWIEGTPLPVGLLGDQRVHVASLGNGSLPMVLFSTTAAGQLRQERILPLTVTAANVAKTFVAGTDFPAGIYIGEGWYRGYDMSGGNAAVSFTSVDGVIAYQVAGPASVGTVTAKNPASIALSMAGTVFQIPYVLETQLRATQSDLVPIKAGFFGNRQRIGYQTQNIPDGNDVLPNVFFGPVDPVLADGFLTGIPLYAKAVGQLTIQPYTIVDGKTIWDGTPVVINVLALNLQYVTLPTPRFVKAGTRFAFRGAGIVARGNGERTDGSGVFLDTLSDGGVAPVPQYTTRFHIGFDISEHGAPRNLITVRSSDKILFYRNSYPDGRYGLRGKDIAQQVTNHGEWRVENESIAGFGVPQLLSNARTGGIYHAYARMSDINPTWVVVGEMTNSSGAVAAASYTFQGYLDAFRQLIETVKSFGAGAIVATEHNQTFPSSGSGEVSSQIIWKLAQDHGAIPLSVRGNANVFGPAFGGYATDYPGWNNGGHPGTRYAEIVVAAYIDLLATKLGRPDESLRAFRPRPNKDGTAPTVAGISALLFEPDDLNTRHALFREVEHGQGALSDANEKYVDRIDQVTNTATGAQAVNVPSEYLAWQTGRSLPFTDYTYIEGILPAAGKNVPGVGVYVSDPTAQVYLRDTLYTDLANPNYPGTSLPTGGWRPLSIDTDGFARLSGGNLVGAIHFDKVCFLIVKAGAFTLAEPVIEWYGTRGKVKQPLKASNRPRGTALIANPYLANGGALAVGWAGTGSPSFGTGLSPANMLPRGATADVRVSSSAKIYVDLSWTADQFHDREIEIEVWATGVRPLVDSAAAYPSAASLTRYTNDYETLVVEIVGGTYAVPHKSAVPQYWRRISYRTMVAAGSTGMRLQLSSATTNQIAVGYAQATFVEP